MLISLSSQENWDKLKSVVRDYRVKNESPIVAVIGTQRSKDQNAKMWAMLQDISAQVEWFGRKHDSETWKLLIISHVEGCELIPNLANSGFVAIPLNPSSSKRSVADFAEVIEAIYAFGSERDVVWSEPALRIYEQYAVQNESQEPKKA